MMSTNSTNKLEDLFAKAANIEEGQTWLDPSLEAIIKDQLSKPLPPINAQCELEQIGEFIVRASSLISRLMDRLIDDKNIIRYTQEVIQDLENEDGLSDMSFIDYMSAKHTTLKEIAAAYQGTAVEVETLWKESPKPPEIPTSKRRIRKTSVPDIVRNFNNPPEPRRSPLVALQSPTAPRSLNAQVNRHVNHRKQHSPRLDDSIQGELNEVIANLSSRGKGIYTCLLRESCKKGGVGPNGELVKFTRNSAFRAHLEKHGKRYKCDIPGCRNKEGFARKDQLQRHKHDTVMHVDKNPRRLSISDFLQ